MKLALTFCLFIIGFAASSPTALPIPPSSSSTKTRTKLATTTQSAILEKTNLVQHNIQGARCPFLKDSIKDSEHSKLLCELWRQVKVDSTDSPRQNSDGNVHVGPALDVSDEDEVLNGTYRTPTPKELKELMHVDDADDELKDKEKMEKIEAQQEALKKMHIRRILEREELMNKMRDFAGGTINVMNFHSKTAENSESVPITASMNMKESLMPGLKEPIVIDPISWLK